MTIRTTLTAITVALAGSAGQAQELYVGAGADYGFPHSGDSEAFGSFVAGVIFDVGPVGIGVEGDVGQQITDGDDRETSRVRALLTYDFGNFTGIASAGIVQYERDDVTFDGEAFGLGAQMPLYENLDGRLEFIRDFVGGDFETNVTTTRLSVLYKF